MNVSCEQTQPLKTRDNLQDSIIYLLPITPRPPYNMALFQTIKTPVISYEQPLGLYVFYPLLKYKIYINGE